MSLINSIEKAIVENFSQQHNNILNYLKIYEEANKYVEGFGKDAFEDYKNDPTIDKEMFLALEKAAEQYVKDLSGNPGLEIELLINHNKEDKTQILTPIKKSTSDNLLSGDVLDLINFSLESFSSDVKQKLFNDYVVFDLSSSLKGNEVLFYNRLRDIKNERLDLCNITFSYTPSSLELAEFDFVTAKSSNGVIKETTNGKKLLFTKNVTKAMYRESMILVDSGKRHFFPGYKEAFTLQLNGEDHTVYMGADNKKPHALNGFKMVGLRKNFKDNFEIGESLSIYQIKPMREYLLEKN